MSVRVLVVVALSLGLVACGGEEGEALYRCRDEVKSQLRDPSGARIRMREFEETGGREYHAVYEVRGENAFGGMATQNFECVIAFTDADGDVMNGYTYRVIAFPARRQ